jgi:hypothetical protein
MKLLANALGDHRVDDVVQNVYEKVEGFCKTSIKYYRMSPYGVTINDRDLLVPCR